jgi:hypothetical protein
MEAFRSTVRCMAPRLLGGVPAHYALVLMGALPGVGLLPVSKLIALAVLAGVVAT